MNYYITTSATTGATTIVQLPLAFVRSGSVNVNNEAANYVGANLYEWSQTTKSAASAYCFGANPNEVYSSYSGNHYVGRSLRCRTHGRKK